MVKGQLLGIPNWFKNKLDELTNKVDKNENDINSLNSDLQGEYIPLTFASGYDTYSNAKAFRQGNLIVINGAFACNPGVVFSSTTNTHVATLPEGYRPSTGVSVDGVAFISGSGSAYIATVAILADGKIVVRPYGQNTIQVNTSIVFAII